MIHRSAPSTARFPASGCFRPPFPPWLLALVAAVLMPAARAQVLDEVVFTLATTTRDTSGRDWAYLVVQPTRPDLLAVRRLAVYRKAGNADSTASYERRSILGLQTDPLAIRALLARAANLGDNLADLSGRVDSLFAAVIPSPALPLEEKLSAAIRGSISRPDHFANLVQLGRLHPAVEMALGLAHAEIVTTGASTFEVREFDAAADADIGVLGRVTVQTGSPLLPPRPGVPFQVPDASGKGHLNVKLRWSTSPEFRRVSLLGYGFNLYRMRRAFAEQPGNNYAVVPPTPAQMATLLLAQPTRVQQVNPLPILPGGILDESPAVNPSSVYNPTNNIAFVTDDNGLARGGAPFANGDQFYYFVAGRDLLGRIGLVSTGALVTLCDRIPPDAPRLPQVANDYRYAGGVESQRLRVTWSPVTTTGDGETVTGYYVYRWRSPSEATRNASNPLLNRASAFIPHVPGQTSYAFLDDGPDAPAMPAAADRTFWYTVRAVDGSACGGNLSANSPAAFGVLRDRVAPAGPAGGGVLTLCCDLLLDRLRVTDERLPGQTQSPPENATFDLVCERRDSGIAWAELWFEVGLNQNPAEVRNELNYQGRVHFGPGETRVVRRIEVPGRLLSGSAGQTVLCRVGDSRGETSGDELLSGEGFPGTSVRREFSFAAATRCRQIPPSSLTAGRGCGTHVTRPPGPVGADPAPLSPPVVQVPLTPTTKEYRLYRRVDFGPLQLIRQGLADYDSVTNVAVLIPDNDMPASSAVICYHAQLFDQNGNGSPLTQLGDCVPVQIDAAKPLLAALEPAGTEADPGMKIRWFCPPAGIRRFLVCVAAAGLTPPDMLSPDLGTNTAPPLNYEPVSPGLTNIALKHLFPSWGCYLTPLIGPNFGDGAAFEIVVPIQTGRRYHVKIRTVDASGAVLKTSNSESLLWNVATAAGPQVPWPARPLPPLEAFNTNISAVRVKTNDFNGLGVLIGGGVYFGPTPTTVIDDRQQGRRVVLTGQVNPSAYVFTNRLGDPLLPIALYRYQVPNPLFPKVSGDLVQVSPLMERFASVVTNSPGGSVITAIHDPFVYLTAPVNFSDNGTIFFMVLKDTQPAVIGATYRYLLVRFDALGEITEVIPVKNSVDATP